MQITYLFSIVPNTLPLIVFNPSLKLDHFFLTLNEECVCYVKQICTKGICVSNELTGSHLGFLPITVINA